MSADVLEQNVRRLLRRAYLPALPSPHYRDRLEALVLGELARRARQPRPRRAAAWLAAAAALLAALLGLRWVARPAVEATRAGLLARDEVALGLPDGSWRAPAVAELAAGVPYRAPGMIAATPSSRALEILVADGRLRLEPASELELAGPPERVLATLRAGAAAFRQGPRRIELELRKTLPLGPEEAARIAVAPGSEEREALAPTPSADGPAAPGTDARVLRGRVFDAASGAPIEAFTVALLRERLGNETHAPVRRDFRASDGRFAWLDPPGGRQRIFVHAEGFALAALGEHGLDSGLGGLEVALEPGCALSGSVLDVHGSPVAGALVLSEQEVPCDGLSLVDAEAFTWLPIRARSGSDGRFELTHLWPGAHTLRASAEGYAPTWCTVAKAEAPRADELVLELHPGGTLVGRVTGADGGPWADGNLVVLPMEEGPRTRTNFGLVRTDDEGRYRVEHLPAVTMIVVLLRDDERPDVRPVQIVEGGTVTVDFSWARSGTHLAGRLLDAEGAPIARQNLALFERDSASWNQDWVASTTRADGGFDFEGLGTGGYQIFLIDEMGQGLVRVDELEIDAGEVERTREVRLTRARLEVHVRTALADAPVEKAILIASSLDAEGRELFAGFALSDAAGRGTIGPLAPGVYRVVAYPSTAGLGYAASESVHLGDTAGAALELHLGPGGPATILARDADGRALEGAAVTFVDARGLSHNFSRVPLTDAAGRYRAEGLAPGRYRVRVELAGHAPSEVLFLLELGREPEIPVVLSPLTPR